MMKHEHLIDKAVVFGVGLGFMAVIWGAEFVWRHFIGVEDWPLLPFLMIGSIWLSKKRRLDHPPVVKGLAVLGYLFLFGIVTPWFCWSFAHMD